MIFFKNKSLEDEKFPGGRGIYIKKISIYLSILIFQQFQTSATSFCILIIHEVAKDHLSLTNIQYETVYTLAIRRLCLRIHIRQQCIIQKPLNIPISIQGKHSFSKC